MRRTARERAGRRLVLLLPVLCGWLLLAGCASRSIPAVEPPPDLVPPTVPVVVVPGMTGSKLSETESGRTQWGTGAALFFPRDGGYGLARPIPPADLSDGRSRPARPSRLRATGVVDSIRLLGITTPIYSPIEELFVRHGYRRGDLERPDERSTLYFFAYDWRLSNAATAARLAERLEALRRARGEERLRVALVCQSNGAHVCRYLAKYGGTDPRAVASGDARGARDAHPAGSPRVAGRTHDGDRPGPGLGQVNLDKLVLVGASNGGSLRILRLFLRGRRYLLGGRRLQPEMLFTLPALYQDLPVYRDDLFLDADGEPLAVDIWDPAAWERYGWSIFAPEVARRLARRGREDLFGNLEARRSHLARRLADGRRFQRLLARDPAGWRPPRLYLVGSVSEPTPFRAVLEHTRSGAWRTLFAGDRALGRRTDLAAALREPGDGHATRESLLHLSPAERTALARPPLFVEGEHFDLILAEPTQRWLMEVLRE